MFVGDMAFDAISQSVLAAVCIANAVRVGLFGFGQSTYAKPSPESPRIKPSPRAGTPSREEQQQRLSSPFSLPSLPASDSKVRTAKIVSPAIAAYHEAALAAQERDEPWHLHHPPLHLPTTEGEGLGMGMAARSEKMGRPWSGRLSHRGGSSSTTSPATKQVVKCSVM